MKNRKCLQNSILKHAQSKYHMFICCLTNAAAAAADDDDDEITMNNSSSQTTANFVIVTFKLVTETSQRSRHATEAPTSVHTSTTAVAVTSHTRVTHRASSPSRNKTDFTLPDRTTTYTLHVYLQGIGPEFQQLKTKLLGAL